LITLTLTVLLEQLKSPVFASRAAIVFMDPIADFRTTVYRILIVPKKKGHADTS